MDTVIVLTQHDLSNTEDLGTPSHAHTPSPHPREINKQQHTAHAQQATQTDPLSALALPLLACIPPGFDFHQSA